VILFVQVFQKGGGSRSQVHEEVEDVHEREGDKEGEQQEDKVGESEGDETS
jgi:hypothetical protein